MKVVVTDLTRFKKDNNDLCVAGVDPDSGQCYRPCIPDYMTRLICKKENILPGTVLEGDFDQTCECENPHIEDCSYGPLEVAPEPDEVLLRQVLDRTMSDSVAKGFGVELKKDQKYIPLEESPACSIVTVSVKDKDFSIVKDGYTDKCRVVFQDMDEHKFWYVPMADYCYSEFFGSCSDDQKRKRINTFLRKQDEIILRIGIGRPHESNGKNGYWFQVNGIYSFPKSPPGVRCYVDEK